SSFLGNTAGFVGGGIDLGDVGGGGTATISSSLFSANTAGLGGGAISTGAFNGCGCGPVGGWLQVSNSTFDSNSASSNGGAIDIADAAGKAWTSVVGSTFERNSVGNGIRNDINNGDTAAQAFTILAGDILADGCGARGQPSPIPIEASAYNDAADRSCNSATDTTSTPDPAFDTARWSLANNGGPTQTVEPVGSAIGLIPAGVIAQDLVTAPPGSARQSPFSTTLCGTTDQRGVATNGPCNAGAVQFPSTTLALGSSANPSTTNQPVTYTATLTLESFQSVAPGGTVTFSDNGSPISGCTARPLTAGSNNTTYTATCPVTYTAAGTHPITISYSRDSNYAQPPTPTALSEVVNAGSSTGIGGFPTPTPTPTPTPGPNPPPSPPPTSPPPTQGGSSGVTPDGGGYWIITPGNGVGNFGDAGSFGSEQGQPLNAPLVAVAGTPDGKGYWTVGGDGGVFAHGDAGFFGSAANLHLNAPI